MLLNILYVRIKRAIFLEQHKEAMPASLGHMLALKAGAVFGALCLVGMQGIVNFIFEFPFVPVIVIGQFVMAIIATGLISILAYEVIRFLLAWRYRSTGKPVYRAVFNWLSVKVDKQGKPASSTTQLFSMKDKTVMSE